MKFSRNQFAVFLSIWFVIGVDLTVQASPVIGSPVPNVLAVDHLGQSIELKQLKGKWVLFYFYPKDDTPGCTKQACMIRDEYAAFKKAGIIVLGVSKQGKKSHEEFAAKYKIPFSLLMDEDGKIGEALSISNVPLIGKIMGLYRGSSELVI